MTALVEQVLSRREIDPRWIRLQQVVAVGMIVVLLVPMVAFLDQFVPPLGIASAAFFLLLVLTWFRPGTGAIGIGLLSAFWLVGQVVNYAMVLPDLVDPSSTLAFVTTLGMIVIGLAGVVGLVGTASGSSGRIARYTLAGIGAILAAGVLLILVVGF